MATIDLGKLGFVNKGTYSSSTSYEKNDLVQYTDSGVLSTYLYINAAAATGQTPSTSGTVNGTYWAYYAKGVADAVASAGNNKVLVTNASGNLTPLAIGSASQVLKVNSGANGFEFGADGGASIVSTTSASTGDYGNGATLDPLAVTITPKSTSSKILIMASAHGETNNGGWDTCIDLRRAISGGATTDLITALQTGGTRNGFSTIYSAYGAGDNDSTPEGFNLMVVDTPNTTSACEYKMVMRSSESFKLNKVISSGHERFASTCVAIDFGG
jgi:hypothetical protein